MPGFEQILTILKKTSLFNGIDDAMLEEIVHLSTLTHLQKKSVIFSSDTKDKVFIILSGRAKLSSINPDIGREYVVSLLEPGDAFDLISWLGGTDDGLIVEAIDDLQLLSAPITIARSWVDMYPQFNKQLFPYLGKRMRSIKKTSESLALYDTTTRLARLIVTYIDNNALPNDAGLIPIRLINDLPHEILAQMIGSARKVVNQNLQTLKKEGIIASVDGRLFVKDLDRLVLKSKMEL